MAHKHEHISTGEGFSVLNDGIKKQVITQAGEIVADAVFEFEIDTEVVNIAKEAKEGTATVAEGATIIGFYPTTLVGAGESDADLIVERVSITGTTLKVELSGEVDTAESEAVSVVLITGEAKQAE